MNKKSQIQLFESIAVLIIFIFLVSVGLNFYTSSKMSSLRAAEREFSELNSVKTSIILSSLPEITCSMHGVIETACLDLYKVRAWNKLMESDDNILFIDYYVPILGYSEIFVEKIYPGEKETWLIYNASMTGSFDYLRVPVIIHDTYSRKNKLGVLHVKTYYG